MTGPELSRLLERVADDGGRPLRTDLDALLARARRSAVRRQRTRATVALVAAAAAVAAIALLPSRLASTARPEPAPPVATEGPLTSAETVARCTPQLRAYAGLRDLGAHPEDSAWALFHPSRRYRVGDAALLVTRAGTDREDSVLCLVPRAGDEDRPVDLARLTPGPGDTRLLAQVCSEQAGETADGRPSPDLAGATVVASAGTGGVTAALLRDRDGRDHECVTAPPTWGGSIAGVGETVPSVLWTTFGSYLGSTYFVLVGRAPASVRTFEATTADGTTQVFRVTGGHVVAVVRTRTAGDVRGPTWRMLAADGTVVRSGEG